MALIECALHFPFQKLHVSDFPLQRLLILMAIDRHGGGCETHELLERLPAFTKASVSRHLKALRELKLVHAKEVSQDLRRKSWRMSKAGKRFMNEWRAEVTMLRDMMLHVRAREETERATARSRPPA